MDAYMYIVDYIYVHDLNLVMAVMNDQHPNHLQSSYLIRN